MRVATSGLLALAACAQPTPVGDDTDDTDTIANGTDSEADTEPDAHDPCPAVPGRLRDCYGPSGLRHGRRALPWFPAAIEQLLVPGDVDGDGLPDLVSTEPFGPVRLWRNTGRFTFEDVTAAWGLDLEGAWGADLADLDGDGDLDLVVTAPDLPARAEAWLRGAFGQPSQLVVFQNTGTSFVDRTTAWGFGPVACATRCVFVGASFADVDGDGRLDVFPIQHIADDQRGVVFVSGGDDRWERDDRLLSGVVGEVYAAVFGDFDNDGAVDLLPVVNHNVSDTSFPRLFRRVRSLFVERSTGSRFFGSHPETSAFTAASTADYDHDGDLDVALADYRMVLLLRANGDATFEDVVLADDQPSQAVIWFDHDGDGWEDLWSFPGVNEREPLPGGSIRLWKNDRGTLTEVAPPYAEPDLAGAVGVAVSDLDRDGRPDLILGGAEARPRVLRNGFDGRWLSVALRSDVGPTHGDGARVEVRVGAHRSITDLRPDGSPGTTSENVAHFGLAGAASATEVRVRWADGLVETWSEVPAGHQVLTRGSGTAAAP